MHPYWLGWASQLLSVPWPEVLSRIICRHWELEALLRSSSASILQADSGRQCSGITVWHLQWCSQGIWSPGPIIFYRHHPCLRSLPGGLRKALLVFTEGFQEGASRSAIGDMGQQPLKACYLGKLAIPLPSKSPCKSSSPYPLDLPDEENISLLTQTST